MYRLACAMHTSLYREHRTRSELGALCIAQDEQRGAMYNNPMAIAVLHAQRRTLPGSTLGQRWERASDTLVGYIVN